jgi:hypothetical protein
MDQKVFIIKSHRTILNPYFKMVLKTPPDPLGALRMDVGLSNTSFPFLVSIAKSS